MSGEGVHEEYPHSGDSQPGPSGINSTSPYNRFTARTFPTQEKPSTSGTQEGSSKPAAESANADSDADEDRPTSAAFECNICLDVAKDAVVSMCGHLFCWPCIFQWFETRPNSPLCPVCKAGISKDKVVPIYGHGNEGKVDPRDKVPPRPQGTRPTPEPSSAFNNLGFGEGGLQLSFGIGAFPFSIFASTFNIGGGVQAGNPPQANGTHQDQGVQDINEFLQKIFLYIAALFMIWLLVA